MDPKSAAEKAVGVIGMGYDLTADIQLSACKAGPDGARLIQLEESETVELVVPGGVVVTGVPGPIKCGRGERTRFRSDALSFIQMSEQINQELSLSGKIPSGMFNSMFDFKACWQKDQADTKLLAFDGWFISLYNIELERSQMTILSDHLIRDVPPSWDPDALVQFISKYGTHIVVGVKMGGKDVIHIKQLHNSKNLEPAKLLKLLKQLADGRFSEDSDGSLLLNPGTPSGLSKDEQSVLWDLQSQFANATRTSVVSLSRNEDIVCNHIRCGGLDQGQSHGQWLSTVSQSPKVISMAFVPITSLLNNVQGRGMLCHAINLYLRYKPPIEELHEFLEFQRPRQWAPVYSDLPLARSKKEASPSLQFTFLGRKIFVNTMMADSSNRPVTGIRLFLEGRSRDHLAIHLLHLSSVSPILQITDNHSYDQGSDEQVKKCYFEPVKWSTFSHICTIPVEYRNADTNESASIVTKAWFEVKKVGNKKVLFLRLGFSTVAFVRIRRSVWDGPAISSRKSELVPMFSTTFRTGAAEPDKARKVNINSAVYPGGPPFPTTVSKVAHFVDTKEISRGPGDPPGHWVVTGAKLCVEGGRIGVDVKFSLLKICPSSSEKRKLIDTPCP